jgi:hypothetical protein
MLGRPQPVLRPRRVSLNPVFEGASSLEQFTPTTSTVTVTSTCQAKKPTASAYSPLLSLYGVNIGLLPDWGESGPRNTMAELNDLITDTGNKHATFGYYAQAYESAPFDGVRVTLMLFQSNKSLQNQLYYIMPDLLASGAIFEPAVMPVGSWAGFTKSNNSQAILVAKVMRDFTDAGIEVRLRFVSLFVSAFCFTQSRTGVGSHRASSVS